MEVAGIVLAVIPLSAKVFQLCSQYYSAVNDAKEEIDRLRKEVTDVTAVFSRAEGLINGPNASKMVALQELQLHGVPVAVESVKDALEQLDSRLAPPAEKKRRRLKKLIGFSACALKWPLKSQEVDTFIQRLERHKNTLNTALTVDIA